MKRAMNVCTINGKDGNNTNYRFVLFRGFVLVIIEYDESLVYSLYGENYAA